MKNKLRIPAAILALILSLAMAAGQAINPATGLPQANPTTGTPNLPVIDPMTGLPVAPQSEWKDPNWKDPDITLADVQYDNLPLSEVAKNLRAQFKQQFDIILPGDTSAASYVNGLPMPASWPSNWRDEQIQLHLRDVTASEIFGAMNLLFENNRTPLRWELKVLGHRQLALLRVLIDPVPQNGQPNAGQPAIRRIYFVGDLIGDEKTGGMTMEQIIKTVTDIWKMSDTANGNIQFHTDAQLLVVSGTPAQIDFVEQTLKALREKAALARQSRAKSSPDESKN